MDRSRAINASARSGLSCQGQGLKGLQVGADDVMFVGETRVLVDRGSHLPDLVHGLLVFGNLNRGEDLERSVGELGADVPDVKREFSQYQGGV
ncbi:unnamed protein product [Prunus armeniaca]|uniref:Uncharacterized protein n=1 Tax=Prunus armeniaca TaxID=36596 RepID=A0A6J5Y2H2_PRUAR|nr:unnamed protein product [Prunus armeniaca]